MFIRQMRFTASGLRKKYAEASSPHVASKHAPSHSNTASMARIMPAPAFYLRTPSGSAMLRRPDGTISTLWCVMVVW
jgi:hypothetical protein